MQPQIFDAKTDVNSSERCCLRWEKVIAPVLFPTPKLIQCYKDQCIILCDILSVASLSLPVPEIHSSHKGRLRTSESEEMLEVDDHPSKEDL